MGITFVLFLIHKTVATKNEERQMILSILLACQSPEQNPDFEEEFPLFVPPCTDCVLQDENNYTYTSELSIGRFHLQPEQNVLIEWSELSLDVQQHEMNSEMIEQLTLVVFLHLDTEEIEARLADDTLLQADISLYVICTPQNMQCELADFGILGANIHVPDHFVHNQGVWMVALRSQFTSGAHSFAFLVPDETSTSTEVNISNQTSSLDVVVDFNSLEPLLVSQGVSTITIDWKELTKDGLGNETDPSKIDEMFIGHYTESLEELQSNFFDLDREYDEFWQMDLGTDGTANLADLNGETPFTGFDSSGTWLMALQCSTCLNPAPRFITQVITD
jgi:hypothetical protein